MAGPPASSIYKIKNTKPDQKISKEREHQEKSQNPHLEYHGYLHTKSNKQTRCCPTRWSPLILHVSLHQSSGKENNPIIDHKPNKEQRISNTLNELSQLQMVRVCVCGGAGCSVSVLV